MSYQTGALDMTLLNGEQVDQVKDDPEFTSVGAGYLWYISPNMAGVPELANENLRKAMTFALDRDAITGRRPEGWLHPLLTPPCLRSSLPAPTAAISAPTRPSLPISCAYDADKAKEYYEAGQERAGQGLLHLRYDR